MERSRRLVYSPPIIQEGTDCSVGILQSYGCRSYSQHFCCCLQHQLQGEQEHTDVLWHVFINIHNTMKSIVLGDILLINGGKMTYIENGKTSSTHFIGECFPVLFFHLIGGHEMEWVHLLHTGDQKVDVFSQRVVEGEIVICVLIDGIVTEKGGTHL